jgi:hypothetical protein
MGGVPKEPKLIEGWLRSKAGIEDAEEIRRALLRTLEELGAEVAPEMSYEELERASEKLAGVKQTTGFKRTGQGLYIEARQIKAAIKEACNIVFEWQGSQKAQRDAYGVGKSARSFLAERVFVEPDQLLLGRQEPDGIELFVGHVSGAGGPRSTLGYHEYVSQAEISFEVLVTKDAIPHDWWPQLWTQMEQNAIGALRSQGFGKFDIVEWQQLDDPSPNGQPATRARGRSAALASSD